MQKNIMPIAIGTGFILLIPVLLTLLAIWHWRPGALVLAFILLFGGAGLTYGLVAKKMMSNKAYRFAVGVALAAVFLLVWMNAAVGGILGDDPANMMYLGVLLVGFIGAVIARLEPQGMSRALFATAFAMALVPAIALIIGTPAFANGVSADFGLSTPDETEAAAKAAMVHAARRVVVLADSSKLDAESLVRFACLDEIDTLITDAAPPPDLAEALADADVQVVLA